MKLLFKLVVNILARQNAHRTNSQFCAWNLSIFQKRNMLVAENFIRSLVSKYGRHSVYTEDVHGIHPSIACKVLKLRYLYIYHWKRV